MRNQRGQALVLACAVMVVLAIAVLTTLRLGHAVHERVHLQNTADAAAYSVAAVEARAFNFYALANRTQASHYVSAMAFQSLLSFLYFGEAFLTDVYGVAITVSPCAASRDGFWKVACPVLEAAPYLGPALRFLNGVFGLFEKLVQTYQRVLRASSADEVIGRGIVPGLRTLNSGLALLSTHVMEGALGQVASTARGVIRANDPDVEVGETLSACLFDRAHMREANGSPFAPNVRSGQPIRPRAREETSKHARAKRSMAQVANASRYACDGDRRCPERFLTSRKPGELWAVPAWLRPMSEFLDHLPKWGQTRLLSYNLGKGWDDSEGGNFIREPNDAPNAPGAMLAQGDNLGADDLYELKLPGGWDRFANPFACEPSRPLWECWGDPRRGHRDTDGQRPFRFMLKTSIWATNDEETHVRRGGLHWRVAYPGGYPAGPGYEEPSAPGIEREMGLNRVIRRVGGVVGVAVFYANVRPIEDGNHRWPGLAPFPHFEPGAYADACGATEPSLAKAAPRTDDFNQPSAWAVLRKTPRLIDDVALPGGREVRLEALARAQVYYHRPGNWAEQPNFFNPYWRPRLASVYQGRRDLPLLEERLGQLPPPLSDFPQKVVTH